MVEPSKIIAKLGLYRFDVRQHHHWRGYGGMKFLRLIPLLFIGAHIAHAQPLSPFRGAIIKKGTKRARIESSVTTTGHKIKRISPITFKARLRTEGNVVITLTGQKETSGASSFVRAGVTRKDATAVELYQGTVRIRGEEFPAAASVYSNKMMLTFPGRQRGSEGRQRMYTLTVPSSLASAGVARVAAIPQAIFHDKTCHEVDFGRPSKHSHAKTVKPLNNLQTLSKSYRVITISTEADPYLYAIHGEATNAYIARIINTAEVLFEAPLGIRFEIVKQVVYTDLATYSLTQFDPQQLLNAFARNPQNDAALGVNAATFEQDVDVKHLFTGRDLDGAPVGLGYIGTICYMPGWAYSLTQATSEAGAPYYFAHEIGHNLGARHDLTMAGSVMNPRISIGSVFSQGSVNEINDHLSHVGGCLETKSLTPNLANAKLTLKKVAAGDDVKLRGRLLYTDDSPIQGADILLNIGRKQVVARTNASGVFSYTIKKKAGRGAIPVIASTAKGEIQSELLKIKND